MDSFYFSFFELIYWSDIFYVILMLFKFCNILKYDLFIFLRNDFMVIKENWSKKWECKIEIIRQPKKEISDRVIKFFGEHPIC